MPLTHLHRTTLLRSLDCNLYSGKVLSLIPFSPLLFTRLFVTRPINLNSGLLQDVALFVRLVSVYQQRVYLL